MQSTVLAELLLFGRNVWRICHLSEQLLALLLPRECVQTEEKHVNRPSFFEYMDILSCGVEKIFEPNATGGVRFPHWQYLLLSIAAIQEGISSFFKTGIRH